MNAIQAIPTEFKGTTYRSRLEARWAVFFYTLCGVDYQETRVLYEPKTYILKDGTRYLPDFAVEAGEYTTFIEIKPASFTGGEIILEKLKEVCKQNGGGFCYLFKGEPYDALIASKPSKSQLAQLLLLFGAIARSDYERILQRLSLDKTSVSLDVGIEKIDEYSKLAGTMRFTHPSEYQERRERHLAETWRKSKRIVELLENIDDALKSRKEDLLERLKGMEE